jgi:hypothetical protein
VDRTVTGLSPVVGAFVTKRAVERFASRLCAVKEGP